MKTIVKTLWQIAQMVAETDSTYNIDVDLDDLPLAYYCPFCSGRLSALERSREQPFPHDADCIVPKARQLMERRKSHVEVEQ